MRAFDLPLYTFSATSMKADSDGIYVFTGSSACALSVGPASYGQIQGTETAGIRYIKNRGSATVTLSGGASFYDTSVVASLALTAGQGVVLAWDGTYWVTVGKAN